MNKYNARLFSGGFRKKLHTARFNWFKSSIAKLKCNTSTIIELGCFDGKLLDYLPEAPSLYVGLDANWEGGLDLAREKYKLSKNLHFIAATSPADMKLEQGVIFKLAVSMETLEHIPPELVEPYLLKIAQHLDGFFFVSLPNEKGIVFLIKYIFKLIVGYKTEPYTFAELINATLGRMHLVERNQHKGFDFDDMINTLRKHFDIVSIEGIPFKTLFPYLNTGVGVIAKTRRTIV